MVEGSLHCTVLRMGQTKAVRELIRKGASKSVVAGEFGSNDNAYGMQGIHYWC